MRVRIDSGARRASAASASPASTGEDRIWPQNTATAAPLSRLLRQRCWKAIDEPLELTLDDTVANGVDCKGWGALSLWRGEEERCGCCSGRRTARAGASAAGGNAAAAAEGGRRGGGTSTVAACARGTAGAAIRSCGVEASQSANSCC